MVNNSNPLKEKTLHFAIRMVKLYRYLTENKSETVLSKQLLRCGTSPGAMVREAHNAESGSDFIHKLSIAQKEVGETQYWLELLHQTGFISDKEFLSLINDSTELMKLIRSSILTKKKNLKAQPHK